MEKENKKNTVIKSKIAKIKEDIIAQIPNLRGKPTAEVKLALINIVSQHGISPDKLEKLKDESASASFSVDKFGTVSFKNMLSNIDLLSKDISENNLDENGNKKNQLFHKKKRNLLIKFSDDERAEIMSSSKDDAKKIIKKRLKEQFLEAWYT